MADETMELEQGSAGGGHSRGHASYGGPGHDGGHEEAHEGAPEWLISFADNVMLQMGFFVILLALAMQASKVGGTANRAGEGDTGGKPKPGPTAEQLDWAIAVREAFNNPVNVKSTDPRDSLLIQRLVNRRLAAEARPPGQPGPDQDVKTIRPSEYSGLGGTVPFAQDAVQLDEAGQAALTEVLAYLRGRRNVLEIRGHASAAEAFSKPDRGMELSYARARAVAEALVAQGIDWNQIRLVASGDNDRLVQGRYDPQGLRENQRVEVIVTDRAPELEQTPAPTGAGGS